METSQNSRNIVHDIGVQTQGEALVKGVQNDLNMFIRVVLQQVPGTDVESVEIIDSWIA